MKLPAFSFYPGDWLKDPALRRCSHAAKGVWIDMLCLMWENSDSRGVLITASQPWSLEEVAAAVGGNLDTTRVCILELLSKGVARKRPDGAIYCSRIVRDEEVRRRTAERVRNHRNGLVTANGAVTSESEEEGEIEVDLNGVPLKPEDQARILYRIYPKKVGKPEAEKAILRALNRFPFHYLQTQTKAYAAAAIGQDLGFIPYPSTWFNQDRFNDDPSTWFKKQVAAANHTPKPPSIFELKTVLEAKTREAQELRNHHCSEGPLEDQWTKPEHKIRYKQLKKEISDLNKRISSCH